MPNGQELAGAPPQQVQVATGDMQGGDQQLIMQAIEQSISQAIDESGYLDIKRWAQIWPQVAQQLGLNIPFETVLQFIEQNSEMLEGLLEKLGIAGITVDGRQIGVEELAGIGSGANGFTQGQVQTQGQPPMQGGQI